MALLSSASFQGVQELTNRPGDGVRASDIQSVSYDLNRAYEGLLNKNADGGGGAPTNTGHNHTEAGNLLYWPLANACFGCQGIQDFDNFQVPPLVFSQSGGALAAGTDIVLWFWPTLVPSGWAGKPFVVWAEIYGAKQDPELYATLETWGTTSPPSTAAYSTATAVTGSQRVPFRDARNTRAKHMMMDPRGDTTLWVAEVTPAAAGIHAVKIMRNFNATYEEATYIRGVGILPLTRRAGASVNRATTRQRRGATNVTVGNPHASNAWIPIDASVVAIDDAAGLPLMLEQANAAWAAEMLTGVPANGNPTLTLSKGHDHSNAAASPYYGRPLEFVLYSEPYGTVETVVGGGAPTTTNALAGRIYAPRTVGSTTFYKVRSFRLFTPVNAGATKLYVAATILQDESKAANMEVKVTSTPSGGGGNTVTMAGAGGGSAGSFRYELLTHATPLNFQSGGWTHFDVEIRQTSAVGEVDALMGLALFFDQ